MENKVKITIEGLEDEPIIFDNVKQLFLSTETADDDLRHLVACDLVFAGYVAARAQMEFKVVINEVQISSDPKQKDTYS